MLLMQTNVLSKIPECFGLSSPDAPIKHSDKFKDSRPPKTKVFVKKRPQNEPLIRTKSDDEKIRQLRDKNKKLKREVPIDEESQVNASSKSRAKFVERVATSSAASEDDPSSYIYQKTKSKIRWKTKTKIKRSKWNTKSAPVLRRTSNVEEEMTSCTEFKQETNISFAAYVKKRTPNFSLMKTKSKSKSQKLRRSESNGNINLMGFTGRDESLHSASERNVTFNPIFEDEEYQKRENREHSQARDSHVYSYETTSEDHVDKQVLSRDSDVQNNTQVRGSHKNSIPQPRTDHVHNDGNIEINRHENHVTPTCSDKETNTREIEFDLENHVPVTWIDGPLTEEGYESDHVPITSIDETDQEQESDHVPVTCIDDVGDQDNDEDDHVRRPTLIRSGRIYDLDMVGWYDDDNGQRNNHSNRLYNDDDNSGDENVDDDFTTRMLKQTAAILTFDMTSRRRELYTIEEEQEEE